MALIPVIGGHTHTHTFHLPPPTLPTQMHSQYTREQSTPPPIPPPPPPTHTHSPRARYYSEEACEQCCENSQGIELVEGTVGAYRVTAGTCTSLSNQCVRVCASTQNSRHNYHFPHEGFPHTECLDPSSHQFLVSVMHLGSEYFFPCRAPPAHSNRKLSLTPALSAQ